MQLYQTNKTDPKYVEPISDNGDTTVVHVSSDYAVLVSKHTWKDGVTLVDQPSTELKRQLGKSMLSERVDAALFTETEASVYAWLVSPTLEEAVAEALATVKAVHAGMLAKLSGEYTIEERDTWPQQQAWADAYVSNQDEEAKGYLLDMLPASIIDNLTANNVDPAGYLATKIRTKARINKKLMVIAGRVKTEANAAYSAAKSLEDVATITAGLEAKQAEAMQEFAAYVEANT